MNSRTGSPTISTRPVSAITTRPLHIHGAKRFQTAANGSSVRTLPRTRSAIMRLETNTMPIITMWVDCSTGMIQLIDWIFTLMPVV